MKSTAKPEQPTLQSTQIELLQHEIQSLREQLAYHKEAIVYAKERILEITFDKEKAFKICSRIDQLKERK